MKKLTIHFYKLLLAVLNSVFTFRDATLGFLIQGKTFSYEINVVSMTFSRKCR